MAPARCGSASTDGPKTPSWHASPGSSAAGDDVHDRRLPCAVVLATMPPLLAAIANAGRHGVLVKSAAVMERLATTTMTPRHHTGGATSSRPGGANSDCHGHAASEPDAPAVSS